MKFRFGLMTVYVTLALNVFAAVECTENVCIIPGAFGENSVSILSPVGKCNVKKVRQAQRLSSLNGKRIAIVGGSFMASVTHPELKRFFLREEFDV